MKVFDTAKRIIEFLTKDAGGEITWLSESDGTHLFVICSREGLMSFYEMTLEKYFQEYVFTLDDVDTKSIRVILPMNIKKEI